MTTLITGASGGLGRVLREALARQGSDIVGVARNAKPADSVQSCDVTDREAVIQLVARLRPKLIYHLAGSFSHEYDTDYAVNTLAARHLVEAVRANDLDTRIVLIGSAAEYGLLRPEDNPVSEKQVLRPVSVYGLTKAYQTQFGVFSAHALGCDVVVARLFNLMASGLSERLFVGRVERLMDQYRQGEIERIDVGNLEARRDYVDGPQAIRQLLAIASSGTRGEVYHVASGVAVTMREVLHRMLEGAGIPLAAVSEGTIGAGGRKGYDVPLVYADLTRTHSLLEGA